MVSVHVRVFVVGASEEENMGLLHAHLPLPPPVPFLPCDWGSISGFREDKNVVRLL